MLPDRATVKGVSERQLLNQDILALATLVTHSETSGSSMFSLGMRLVVTLLFVSSLLNMCPRSETPDLSQQTLQQCKEGSLIRRI